MADYIDREAFIAQKRELYCKDCDRRKGMKNGKYRILYDIGDVPCRACGIEDVLSDVEDFPSADVQPVKWIPFRVRDLDEEEKADHPEWDWILDGELPEDGQRILVNVKFRGHESVQMDEYYEDDGCYLDSGYEIGTEVTHWMPLPKPPKEE